ncbi:surfeit locus protein 5 subunit 22 of mediator complex-domain-containing protein [Kockiozyma suomiensis]|uniref:surfeit locus protein 5 subunit 22 of mediator complex-domain-containing protein n=1 Tax=Kockiozyma suomiensis TaxID=1337062 RepID=UPI003343D14C
MSSQNAQRALTINQRINEATNQILSEYQEITHLAPVASKDKVATAAETYQIEGHAASMVRAIEDLLVLSRSLKEAWILSQVSSSLESHSV